MKNLPLFFLTIFIWTSAYALTPNAPIASPDDDPERESDITLVHHCPSMTALKTRYEKEFLVDIARKSENGQLKPSKEATPFTLPADAVPAEMEPYIQMVVYVNQAPKGKTAQTAGIFEKTITDDVVYWKPVAFTAVSTGLVPGTTPLGRYYIDPFRRYELTYSEKYSCSLMPYSMYLHYSGAVALHAAYPQYHAKLGQPASKGCIRMPHDFVKELFARVEKLKGPVPQMATYDGSGKLLKDKDGKLKLIEQYEYRAPGTNHLYIGKTVQVLVVLVNKAD